MVSPLPVVRPTVGEWRVDLADAAFPPRPREGTALFQRALQCFLHVMVFRQDREGRPVIYMRVADIVKNSMGCRLKPLRTPAPCCRPPRHTHARSRSPCESPHESADAPAFPPLTAAICMRIVNFVRTWCGAAPSAPLLPTTWFPQAIHQHFCGCGGYEYQVMAISPSALSFACSPPAFSQQYTTMFKAAVTSVPD